MTARRILAYSSFPTTEAFEEWQLANPLCDVMKVEPLPKPTGLSSVVGGGSVSPQGAIFVVWRKYA